METRYTIQSGFVVAIAYGLGFGARILFPTMHGGATTLESAVGIAAFILSLGLLCGTALMDYPSKATSKKIASFKRILITNLLTVLLFGVALGLDYIDPVLPFYLVLLCGCCAHTAWRRSVDLLFAPNKILSCSVYALVSLFYATLYVATLYLIIFFE